MNESEVPKRNALSATYVRQATFASADYSTTFRLVCTDESPSRWILHQDEILVASGIAPDPFTARDEAVSAAKDLLGHDYITVVE